MSDGNRTASPADTATYGEYRFANSQSQIEFCSTVSRPVSFPRGDTLLTVRLRNVNGATGGIEQLIIRSES